CGLIAMARIPGLGSGVKPLSISTQLPLPPPLVLLKNPDCVPAYTTWGFAGSIAMAFVIPLGSPVPTGDQFPPPFVLLNTAFAWPDVVPAKMMLVRGGSMAGPRMVGEASPVFMGCQFPPPLVLLSTPPPKV